jgi:hypothetical protein
MDSIAATAIDLLRAAVVSVPAPLLTQDVDLGLGELLALSETRVAPDTHARLREAAHRYAEWADSPRWDTKAQLQLIQALAYRHAALLGPLLEYAVAVAGPEAEIARRAVAVHARAVGVCVRANDVLAAVRPPWRWWRRRTSVDRMARLAR